MLSNHDRQPYISPSLLAVLLNKMVPNLMPIPGHFHGTKQLHRTDNAVLSNESLLFPFLTGQCTAQCTKVLNHRCQFPVPTALANHELREVSEWLWEAG